MNIYKSKYCELVILKDLEALCEKWHIANCPFEEFKFISDTILKSCKDFKIKNLIIDASDAISYLPDESQEYLDTVFNKQILYETELKTIILISPESLVTRISSDKFFDNITSSNHGIYIIKLRSYADSINWLKSTKKDSK